MMRIITGLLLASIGFSIATGDNAIAQGAQDTPQCMPREVLIEQTQAAHAQLVLVAQINDTVLLEIYTNLRGWAAYYTSAEGVSCMVATGVGEPMMQPYECHNPAICRKA